MTFRTLHKFLPAILLVWLCAGTADAGQVVRDTRMLMGTSVTVMIWHEGNPDGAKAALESAFAEIERIDGLFSSYRPDSEISRINQAAGDRPIPVCAEVLRTLAFGERIARMTQGAFDPTFAGAGRLYDFGPSSSVPTESELAAALLRVGIDKLKLDPVAGTAHLTVKGARIGVGGYVKGYAIDQACAIVRKKGFSDFILNAGGDMYVAGTKGKKQWRIGIQDPRGQRDALIATISAQDRAVVTSGDYERFFIKDGVRYHHILDPRTGRPARLCRSVTVIAESSMPADAMATAIFVLGPEKGIQWIETQPGAECFIIDAAGGWRFSTGFSGACEFAPVTLRPEENAK